MMNKNAMTQMKAMFLIANMIVAILAFSWGIGIVNGEPTSAPQITSIGTQFKGESISLNTPKTITIGGEIKTFNQIKTAPGGNLDFYSGSEKLGTLSNAQANSLGFNYADVRGGEYFDGFREITLEGGTATTALTSENGQYAFLSDGGYYKKNAAGVFVEDMDFGRKVAGLEAQKTAPSLLGTIKASIFDNFIQTAGTALLIYSIGSAIGGQETGLAASLAFVGGKVAADIAKEGFLGDTIKGNSGLFGIAVGVGIFLLMYKKTSTETVEFGCNPFEPPIGGADCELCNEFTECSEYTCKSLGQACGIVNEGTTQQRCVWLNPTDTKSPAIKFIEAKNFEYRPFEATRPPATGVEISDNNDCIPAFTALEFTFVTDEPAQCKIDYNITVGQGSFDSMSYYVGGESLFIENHTEKMSLPSPDVLNALAPEIQNNGIYTLYTRCQDANGNVNEVPFAVRFCVKAGPDTTPPVVVETSIPSNNPVSFNQSTISLGVYVNEPADCKWSREDKDYALMENDMNCAQSVLDMNERNLYTCIATLTGLQDRIKNDYYFRCLDQPEWQEFGIEESDRNPNQQSFLYSILGTQPLNILSVGPEDTIYGSTDTIPVFLTIRTDNGYDNGKAFCYYYNDEDNNAPSTDDDYIRFRDTESNVHEQRQDLVTGDYVYFFKCVDLGGNADYNSTSFRVETDRSPPIVVRSYKDEGQLKIITHENTECSYSRTNCNFEIDEGIVMPSANQKVHTAEWKTTQNYYIRCKDDFDNQPNPNTCSIIVRPYQIVGASNVIAL